jgi:hypothetical protein
LSVKGSAEKEAVAPTGQPEPVIITITGYPIRDMVRIEAHINDSFAYRFVGAQVSLP